MATHASILAWRIPWTEEPGGLGYSPWSSREVDTTERRTLSLHFHSDISYPYLHSIFLHSTCNILTNLLLLMSTHQNKALLMAGIFATVLQAQGAVPGAQWAFSVCFDICSVNKEMHICCILHFHRALELFHLCQQQCVFLSSGILSGKEEREGKVNSFI